MNTDFLFIYLFFNAVRKWISEGCASLSIRSKISLSESRNGVGPPSPSIVSLPLLMYQAHRCRSNLNSVAPFSFSRKGSARDHNMSRT